MNKIMETIRGIKNLGVKLLLAILGLIMIASQVYPFVMRGFLLTDHVEAWDITEWIVTGIGFFFTAGGMYFNTVAEGLANKFKSLNPPGK